MSEFDKFDYVYLLRKIGAIADESPVFAADAKKLMDKLPLLEEEESKWRNANRRGTVSNSLLGLLGSCTNMHQILLDAIAIADKGLGTPPKSRKYTDFGMMLDDKQIAFLSDDGRLVCRFNHIPKMPTGSYYTSEQDLSEWYFARLKSDFDEIGNHRLVHLANNPIRIQYIHVYSNSVNRNQLTDNDNYATKHYTDLVVTCLARSDGALGCSFASDTILSDKIPAGSYCIVSLRSMPLVGFDWLLEMTSKSLKKFKKN